MTQTTSVLAVYNFRIYGTVLGGYGQFVSRTNHDVVALLAILFSPGRGVFFFSPVLLFAMAAPFRKSVWQGPARAFVLACLLLIAGMLLLTSYWGTWWGGWSWGWRLLTETGPLFIFLTAFTVPMLSKSRRLKIAFWVFAVSSVCVQAVGVFCYPGGAWDALPYSVDGSRVWNWLDNPISRSLRAGIDLRPYRNARKLLKTETWTLANSWPQLSPNLILTVGWWDLPAGLPEGLADLHRRNSNSCYLDIAKVSFGEPGMPLSLKAVGWAFDAATGHAPDSAFLEITTPGRAPHIVPAQREARTDVALAFRNNNLLNAGLTADVLLEQPASPVYEIKLLQLDKNELLECVPTGGHVIAK